MLQLVSQNAFTALQVSDVKQHLNISDSSTDALIQGYIDAAVSYCERLSGLDFRPTTWKYILGQFPIWANYSFGDRWGNYQALYPFVSEFAIGRSLQRWQEILLPRGPITAISSIQYYDATNALTTADPATYAVELPSYSPGRIEPTQYWQITYPRPDAVTIQFVSGFSQDNTLVNFVPQPYMQALRLLVGTWWNDREDIEYAAGSVQGRTGEAVECLLSTFTPALYR